MFPTSYVHHQEDYTVHAALYGTYSMCLCKQSSRFFDVLLTVHLSIILEINQLNAQNLLL